MNLKINDRIRIRDIQYFNNFSMNLKYDSVASSFNFNFPFNPKDPDQKELACVSHFHEAIVQHNGETLVTGYIISEGFSFKPTQELVSVSGYSKPGILEDCSIPIKLFPIQYDGISLDRIAKSICSAFGIDVVIDPSVAAKMSKPYETVKANIGDKVKDFLTSLAVQRNIIISHDEKGRLLFTEAAANLQPIAFFDGSAPVTDMVLTFDGQNIHSEITVVKEADDKGGNAGQSTVYNPYSPILFRPIVISQSSGDDVDTKEFALNALASELKNIKLHITIDRWDINGKIVKPNNVVSVLAPEMYIFKKTNWFIEEVAYTGDQAKNTCVLSCVPVEAYNNKTPKNIFVDPHKNLGGV